MAYNKIVYGNQVLVDLTSDTVAANTLLSGIKAHNKAGTVVTGTLFSGYPATVTIAKVTPPTAISKKEKNLVVYNKKTLIDLTADTVTAETLLYGYRCHKKDGTVIDGAFLKNYPDTYTFTNNVLDSSGSNVLDSSGNPVQDQIIYKKSTSGNNIIYTKT